LILISASHEPYSFLQRPSKYLRRHYFRRCYRAAVFSSFILCQLDCSLGIRPPVHIVFVNSWRGQTPKHVSDVVHINKPALSDNGLRHSSQALEAPPEWWRCYTLFLSWNSLANCQDGVPAHRAGGLS
jgi:hypothetical protein